MALVLGTNCGFVTAAPTEDPDGSATTIGGRSYAFKVIAPAGSTKITSVLWYCQNETAVNENFEVGLYSHNAETDLPNNQLYVSVTNAKGTTIGWKTATVDWAITAGTIYWIVLEVDVSNGAAYIDTTSTTGELLSYKFSQTTLLNPWQSDGTSAALAAICAVYLTESETGGIGAMSLNTRFWGE